MKVGGSRNLTPDFSPDFPTFHLPTFYSIPSTTNFRKPQYRKLGEDDGALVEVRAVSVLGFAEASGAAG